MAKTTNAQTSASKKTAAKATVKTVKQPVQDTKVICPVCGSEIAIGAHEHTVKNATVIGADSGLGTIALPISKRGEVLQKAGIDTSKYFSIELPSGGTQMMKMDERGIPVAVTPDDPIITSILSQGTVPNRALFRRWIMSQVFHGLLTEGGITKWIRNHGYKYQWKQFVEELRVQAEHLHGKDKENFYSRNRWFNKELAVAMAQNFIEQLRHEAKTAKQHKCHGIPYVTIGNTHYFVSDIEKKLVGPFRMYIEDIKSAVSPKELHEAVKRFWNVAYNTTRFYDYRQCQAWLSAYKGMGAYATMQNLIRFHGCEFPRDNSFYRANMSGLEMLDIAAITYENGEGWKLFGLLRQMMEYNHVDIKAKQAAWAAAKKARKALKESQAA